MFLATLFQLFFDVHSWYLSTWCNRPFAGRVRVLSCRLVVKRNALFGADEADILRYIRKNTIIPVPRVILSARGFGSTFMLMEFVEGEVLEYAWRDLNEGQRTKVIGQLRAHVMQLRSLHPPDPRAVCGLGGAACKDARLQSYGSFGPFAAVSDFHDHLTRAATPWIDEVYLENIRRRMSDNYRVMFTHSDLAPRNIIVRGDDIAAIIDWEHAGWYPEYWEYVKALYHPMSVKDQSWNDVVKDMIPQGYEKEWKLDKEMTDHMVGAI
ncbi:hypothetical protein CERSUDRAFT_156636 [Gelatoporia subvermispora B]|uniref:Aminoglycoside phosphotransferase domain-containing protein n=1 Tax=Ceriporiopsis subvermispora (strain B) TaxID=914234 RepID=M2QFQ9_CERS8|nr:hypothetical protein CERSUDRAFT_156636 [Gelatoporia subvermispora B]